MNKQKILVIVGNDNSNIKVSERIVKYLNSKNNKNQYFFLLTSNSKKLKKNIKKNIINIKFSNFEKRLKNHEFDWLLNIWSSKIFKKDFLKKFRYNLNLHPSYLPFNRGKDPYCWSIYNQTYFGVTLHEMTEKIDNGKIYLRKKILILFPYTTYDVYKKSLYEIQKLFIENWIKILNGKIKPRKIAINTKLNLRKEYQNHNYFNLDKKRLETNIIRKFILRILSCDFDKINSLKLKLNKKKYLAKIKLNKI